MIGGEHSAAMGHQGWLKVVRCALFFSSETMRPEEITERVGIQPTVQRIKGQPRKGNPAKPVVNHQWIWKPDEEGVERSLDAQLDAIWAALGSRADAFKSLRADAEVVVDILIEHYGDDLRLGWALDRRHVSAAAAFGASIDVDEYDYTGDEA
jgi:Domain of unknown function (DUF4279)